MKAKKHLGQHFLHSEKALSQIIDAVEPHADDIILEIGPGKGVLTKRLVFFSGKVIAVEKDADMIAHLSELFSEELANGKLDLIHDDILEFDPEILRFYKGHPYKLVGNIPYYITGAILEKFLSASYQPEEMTLLIQKEVAQRIMAKDKKESILSISVKAYGVPSIVAPVPAGAFTPAPSVDSAIIHIEDISRNFFADCDEKVFFEVLKAVFGKKRKQIAGSLGDYLGSRERAAAVLSKIGVDPKSRPEDLPLTIWKNLTVVLADQGNSVQ